jgi:tRNA(Ile)-lysidine synthase
MLEHFKAYITKEKLFHPGDRILLAVSGGIDSVAMAELFSRAKIPFGIAHCNFRLRGKESDGDETFVKDLAKKMKVPFFIHQFLTADFAEKHGLSIQMAARELRYQWFDKLLEKEGYQWIATAHHMDDQIETFFINLLRSSGIAGFHGILPKQGKIIRPLLYSSRKEIEIFVNKNKLKYREDSSNIEIKYLRNKIRHELIPILNEMNPDFNRILTENIYRIRETEKIFRESVEKTRKKVRTKEGENDYLAIKELLKLDPLSTYLYEILSPYGFNFTVVLDIVNSLEEEPGKQFFSATHRLIKDREYLIVSALAKNETREQPTDQFLITEKMMWIKKPIHLEFRKFIKDQAFKIDYEQASANLDGDKLVFPLILRKWKRGDLFYPFGRNHRKKLSDFFTDNKFSLADKENAWLLSSGDKIVWIVGHRIDNRFRISPKTNQVLQIRWMK